MKNEIKEKFKSKLSNSNYVITSQNNMKNEQFKKFDFKFPDENSNKDMIFEFESLNEIAEIIYSMDAKFDKENFKNTFFNKFKTKYNVTLELITS